MPLAKSFGRFLFFDQKFPILWHYLNSPLIKMIMAGERWANENGKIENKGGERHFLR